MGGGRRLTGVHKHQGQLLAGRGGLAADMLVLAVSELSHVRFPSCELQLEGLRGLLGLKCLAITFRGA